MWLIFLLDVFKQTTGQGVLHGMNIYLAIFISGGVKKKGSDECSWYFTIFLIDLMPGLILIVIFSKLQDYIFRKCNCNLMISGNYVYDNQGKLGIHKTIYVLQIFSWINVIFFSKITTTLLEFVILPILTKFSSFALNILNFNNVRLLIFLTE